MANESEVLMMMQQQQLDPFFYFHDFNNSVQQHQHQQSTLEIDTNSLIAEECDFDVNFIADMEGDDMLSALPELSPAPSSSPKSPSYTAVAMPTFHRQRTPLFVAEEELNSLTLVGSKQSPPESPPQEDSKEGIPRLSWGDVVGPRRPFLMQRSMSSHALGQLGSTSSNSSTSSTSSNTSIPSSALDSAMQGLACTSALVPSSSAPVTHFLDGQRDTMVQSLVDAKPTIRRVCSTGDIQRMNSEAQDGEAGLKIGKYSMAERRERIHRYRQKRSERNFNKKIKYACRKTLADSRPRVRGRFAKNEEVPDSTTSSPVFLSPRSGAAVPATGGGGTTYGAAAPTVAAALVRNFRSRHEYDEEVEAAVLEEDDGFLIDSQSSGELSEIWGLTTSSLGGLGGGLPG